MVSEHLSGVASSGTGCSKNHLEGCITQTCPRSTRVGAVYSEALSFYRLHLWRPAHHASLPGHTSTETPARPAIFNGNANTGAPRGAAGAAGLRHAPDHAGEAAAGQPRRPAQREVSPRVPRSPSLALPRPSCGLRAQHDPLPAPRVDHTTASSTIHLLSRRCGAVMGNGTSRASRFPCLRCPHPYAHPRTRPLGMAATGSSRRRQTRHPGPPAEAADQVQAG